MNHDADNALARMLYRPVCDPSATGRLGALLEEIRVARLIAHMRPYLLSSATAATQPMLPVQRRATHPAERRLDDITAETRRRDARDARVAAREPVRRRFPPSVPYSGGTR